VFTSSLDSRWGSNWLAWSDGPRFAEQLVRWAAKPAQASDCEISIDVQGRTVNFYVEALDENGEYIRLSNMNPQIIMPDITSKDLTLEQVGPGQYKGQFDAKMSGSHLLNLRYRKADSDEKDSLMQTPFVVPYAPEFSDLTDNIGLLKSVCKASGGRLIEAEPENANLFDTAGVLFPKTYIPLTRELMYIWLGLFLFDVAVRRIAIDFKAIIKKLAAIPRGNTKGPLAQATLSKLKSHQKKVQKDLYRSDVDKLRKKRYQASGDAAEELPFDKVREKKEPVRPPAAKEKKPAASDPAQGHIQQLLNAKKKANRKNDE
jgi:hypothetical protein